MPTASAKKIKGEIKQRLVPAFTYQAYQKNVTTGSPARTDVLKPLTMKNSQFRNQYLRSDFPIQLEFLPGCQKLAWKVEIERLDFRYYLPLFFEGITEITFPFDFLARQAVHDILQHGGHRVAPVVGHLIVPILKALKSRDPVAMASMLKAVIDLTVCHPTVGPALLPYFRLILPVCGLFKNLNVNLGDGIEYRQRKRLNIADLVEELLRTFEKHGGPHAFINIKYIVPTYESAEFN